MIKRFLIILTISLVSLNISAQKQVRDSILMGNKAYKKGLYNTSGSAYKGAIKIGTTAKDGNKTNISEAIYNLGNTNYKQQNWNGTVAQDSLFLLMETKDKLKMSAAWYNRANAQLKKKSLEMARDAYEEALRLNPNDNDARYNLAVVQKILHNQNKNQDKNKDKDKDKNKNKNKDQNKDKNKKDQDKNKKDQNKQDKNSDKGQKKQDPSQMSPEAADQMLQAAEQDEKNTQAKAQMMRAAQQKQQNEKNREQGQNW